MSSDEKEVYDDELRWRLEELRILLEEGNLRIAEHLKEGVEQSLGNVRYGADGKIDLSTVDGRVRSMALMAAHVRQRSRAKEALSLTDVTSAYFGFIESNLGFIAEEAKKRGLDAGQFARLAPTSQAFVSDFAPRIPKFVEALQGFWEGVSDSVDYHLQDLRASKAVYGGDLFPSYKRNICSTSSLYMDTIVLSDPFWNSRHIFERATPETQIHYLAKHAVNVLQYKELAMADVGAPIVAFAPFKSSVDEDEGAFVRNIMIADGLIHAGRLFGRVFGSEEEFWDFTSTLASPEQLVAEIKDPTRLLFDTEWTGSLEDQIRRALDADFAELTGTDHCGNLVASQCFGRMGQATDLLLKSRYLGGVPLIDAPTSWEYFNWKLEYNSAIEPDSQTHLHMVRGLQRVAATDEEWLGNIPPEALIEIRKVGAFQEIRAVLAQGVDEIASANPKSFFRSSDKIVENIRDAFERHSKEVRQLRARNIKFAGFDIGSMVAAGAIDIASIITGTPTFGAASLAVNQLVDAPKLREIPKKFRELKDANQKLRKSPMGLFFKHRPQK